jgi:uncharacterized delta-60 repeat protein
VTIGGKGRTRRLVGVAFLALALAGAVAFAAPGALDRTFGGDGRVTSNFTRLNDVGRALALQADGKIVVAGDVGSPADGGEEYPKFALERLKPDGTLDSSFGIGGKIVTEFAGYGTARAVAIQADGKIVAAGGAAGGSGSVALARYNADGTLDSTFGGDGKVTTAFPGFPYGYVSASAVAIQADGKIVAGGVVLPTETLTTGAFALVRYNPDGTLDSTFDGDGRVVTDMSSGLDSVAAVAIQADGKIVAAGWVNFLKDDTEFGVVRYESDGTLDSTFGEGGKVTTNFTAGHDGANDMVIQPDGKIVAAGFAGGKGGRFALARYNTDGTLDSTFSGDGKVTTNFTLRGDGASGVAIQATGKIVAAGWAAGAGRRFALARYTTDGRIDNTFGGDGKVTTNFTIESDVALDVAIQANGRIVAGGRAGGKGGRFALARYRGG